MGLSLKDLGRGLAAGMQVYGAGKQQEDKDTENQRRFDEQQALREKQYEETSRMNDMKIKEMQQTIEVNQFKKYQQEGLRYQAQVNQGINVSKYEPQYMVGVNNKYNPTGTQLRIIPNTDPNSSAVTYEYGVPREKEGGGLAVDDNGKPVVDWSGATQTYTSKDSDKHLDYWSSQAHPDFTSSERMAGMSNKRKLAELKSAAVQQEEFKIRQEERAAGSDLGVAGLAKVKSETELNKQTAALRKAQAGVAGKPKSTSQIPIREFEAINRKWDDVTSQPQADNINYFMSLENVENRRGMLKDYADGKITKEEVTMHMENSGITSRKFIDDVLMNADDIAEDKRDKEPSAFMKWWRS